MTLGVSGINMNIEKFSHNGPGVEIVYDRDGRVFGLKNYKSENNLLNLSKMECHLKTDEQFLLFQGSCAIVTMRQDGSDESWELTLMEKGAIYNISRGLWHLTIMSPDCRMILVENSGTSVENSEYFVLSENQSAVIRELYREVECVL